MINGKISTIQEFPYVVALEIWYQHNCGGAIISPYYVITAAHCLKYSNDPFNYQVRAGSSFRQQGGTVHQVRKINFHPQYQYPKNDVALLRLMNVIKFDGKTISSISMFKFGEESQPGSTASVAGWGWVKEGGPTSNQLMSIKLSIVDKKACNDSYINGSSFIPKGAICASGSHQSVCDGDSGSPLVVNGKLAGITAFMHNKNGCRSWPQPIGFTEVASVRKWIDNNDWSNVDPVWDEVLMWDLYD